MNESNAWKIFASVTLILIGLILFFVITPTGRSVWNKNAYEVQKADDATNYYTRKQAEDTCRSMVASYKSDRMTWQQYKDSDDREQRSWAEQAKMRANKTAASYNEYILKNSYIWDGNIPKDILEKLEYIDQE